MKRATLFTVICLIQFLSYAPCHAQTVWHVYEDGSGDAPDITTAVLWAVNGDTILVHAGTYYEHNIVVGEDLVIIGVDGAENVIVDAEELDRCFYFIGSGASITFDGFTLKNGLTVDQGGGINCYLADATISNCIIEDCEAHLGGGIYVRESSPAIENCTIYRNYTDFKGGGIDLNAASPTITNCRIIYNSSAMEGGGIFCYNSHFTTVDSCVIAWNHVDGDGGGVYIDDATITFNNCTISHNVMDVLDHHGGGIYVGENGYAFLDRSIVSYSELSDGIYGDAAAAGAGLSCCDVFGSESGNYGGTISDQTGYNDNFSLDPLYCNPTMYEDYDFTISDTSPCRPAASPCGQLVGAEAAGCSFGTIDVAWDGSGDATTIASGIGMALARDTIQVKAGTYTGNGNRYLRLYGKGLYIRSESGPAATIIDGGSTPAWGCNGFIFDYYWRQDTTAVIDGFTITGCSKGGLDIGFKDDVIIRNCIITGNVNLGVNPEGRGIAIHNASPRIENSTISNNATAESGGGIYFYSGGYPRITGCAIENNYAQGNGGGIYDAAGSDWSRTMVVDDCEITGNRCDGSGGGVGYDGYNFADEMRLTDCVMSLDTAAVDGGGIYSDGGLLTVHRCTIVDNFAGNTGAGIRYYNDHDFFRLIVAFNDETEGIYRPLGSTLNIACSDVYGNDGGNYAGSIADPTGTNGNISADPLFCDLPGGDYTIYNISPCAAAQSPCGESMGALGIGCHRYPDLVVSDVDFDDTNPEFGDAITATVKIKNVGDWKAGAFFIDYYEDLSSPPVVGGAGDLRYHADSLAAGDSITWNAGGIEAECFSNWTSYLQVDTDGSVEEWNEGNNVSGPYAVHWSPPQKENWPVAGGGDFSSSPAIARFDDDPATMEVIVGCNDGHVYALTSNGENVPGWPIDIGSPVRSSPAVGNVTGDYHAEVVFGCDNEFLYVFDYEGNQLWKYGTKNPVKTTPALVDLDDDGLLEIVLGALNESGEGCAYAIDDDGTDYPGGWPVNLGGTYASSAAVGDVNGDGDFEIAVVATGYTKPALQSKVFLLDESGASYSVDWPVVVDTVITAAPVMGDIAGHGYLEIIVGGLNGAVYAINLTGSIWLGPPRVPGAIEQPLALTNTDKDGYQEIVVGSRYWQTTFPPFGKWMGTVTLLDNDKSTIYPFPCAAGSWTLDYDMPSPIAFENMLIAGSPGPGSGLYAWEPYASTWSALDGFPEGGCGGLIASPAVGDLDGDGSLELVAPALNDSIYCYDLSCSDDFLASLNLFWPMYRNERTRTGCFFIEDVTAVETPGDAAPEVTCIRAVYPNPFNPATRITFDVAERSLVRIAVYDVSGRKVCVLKDGFVNPGRHEVVWHGVTGSGSPVASGIYFCRLEAGTVSETIKMVLLR
ncbi:MAG TPA: right-handed parallel beta-helix repeat-containing protein [Patescibacteria group bacterium]|nr:right-handed parallel beta-helix repeat-containing protein [Patescibacteria group bacterium]